VAELPHPVRSVECVSTAPVGTSVSSRTLHCTRISPLTSRATKLGPVRDYLLTPSAGRSRPRHLGRKFSEVYVLTPAAWAMLVADASRPARSLDRPPYGGRDVRPAILVV
jgi:hypothetical protein